MEKSESLADLRKEIDLTDHDILRLLNQRMEIVLRLKRLKSGVTDHDRELEVFRHIRRCSRNLIQSAFSEKLFREIIAESKRIQKMKLEIVGFQGEHGAYGETAAMAYDATLIPIPCGDFAEVFEWIENGHLDLGIVPVENSIEGAIAPVNNLLIDTDLHIVGEITIPIHHALLAPRERDCREIKVVYSHPQALAQCRAFIARNKLEARPFYDTAGAAKMIARGEVRSAAAIAGTLCAELYNLKIVKKNIEDRKSNSTRFVILSRRPSGRSGVEMAGQVRA